MKIQSTLIKIIPGYDKILNAVWPGTISVYASLIRTQNNCLPSWKVPFHFQGTLEQCVLVSHNKSSWPSCRIIPHTLCACGLWIRICSNTSLDAWDSYRTLRAGVPWSRISDIFFCTYFIFSFRGYPFSSSLAFSGFFFPFLPSIWSIWFQGQQGIPRVHWLLFAGWLADGTIFSFWFC